MPKSCLHPYAAALLLTLFACNQGGETVHVKKPMGVMGAANAAEHPAGRYDLSYKTESECKSNQGSWDSEEGECFIMCMAPKTFDKGTSKCVQTAVKPDASGHEPGRVDLSFKTEAACKENYSTWDSAEGECYVICLAPNTFDKSKSKCMEPSGHELGRHDLSFKTESTCKSNKGLWDSEEGECFTICMPTDTFDKAKSTCVKAAGAGAAGGMGSMGLLDTDMPPP